MRLLLPLLMSFLVPAAPADEAFESLRRDFPATVAGRENLTERLNVLARVAQYDDREGARLLVDGLAALVERYEKDLKAFEKLRKEYAEVDTPVDVMKDDYKTRTELQNRIKAEEEVQRGDRRVFEAFVTSLARYESSETLSEAVSRIRREKAATLREVAAEGIASNPGGLESALRLAKEKDEKVLLGVLRGLRGRKEDRVFDLALGSLESGSWVVRLHAASLLEAMNQPRVVRPLIEALGKEEGRLRDDLRDILRRLTAQNFDVDAEEWKRWYLENLEDFEGAGPKSALFGAFKRVEEGEEKKGVYGIHTRSRRILFIIDTSGSMKNFLAGKSKPRGTVTGVSLEEEEYEGTKIEVAKRELKRAIRALEPDALFNIVSFASNVIRWKPNMVKADMAAKNEAYLFVREMEAVGGTWTYGALQEAFRIAGLGATDRNYDPTVDTIYFISDGAPTDNDMLKPQLADPEEILAAVRDWNRLGGVVIHAVAIDPKAGGAAAFIAFMKKLAEQNGGKYTQRE